MIDRTHLLPVRRQCQLLKLARSTAYYHATPVSETALALMRRIDELHLAHPFAGARMLRDLLRQEGQTIGRRHVATLMRRMGIEALYRKPSSQPAASGPSGVPLSLARPYDLAPPIRSGPPILPISRWREALCICLRSSTGRVAGCWPGASPTRSRPISVWRPSGTPWPTMARRTSSIPIKGANLRAKSSPGLLMHHGIQISMDGKGCWRDNVFVERLWKSIKYEEVYLHAYDTVSAAHQGLERYLTFYNQTRPHQALDGQTLLF
jgi:putative transposase